MQKKSMKIIIGFVMFSVLVTGGTLFLNSDSKNKQEEERVSLSNARPGFFTGGYNKNNNNNNENSINKKSSNPRVIYIGEQVPVVNVVKY